MNTIRNRLLTLALIACTTASFAIEGLKLTIRCPDVVLSWPSTNDETYIVQYRPTLDTNSTWTTLTNFLPAKVGTNITTFVHSNRVDCPPGQVFGMMQAGSGSGATLMSAAALLSDEEKQAIRMLREEVRLKILLAAAAAKGREPYPWELLGQPPLPWDQEAIKSGLAFAESGSGSISSEDANGPQPDGGGDGGGGEPGCGFYRVVRNSVHLVGITNGMVVSGTLIIPVEVGHDEGDLTGVSLTEDGAAISPEVSLSAPFQSLPTFALDTTRMSNGVHTIAGHASWAVTNQPLPYFDADSPLVEIIVSNIISFPDWMPTFGQDYDACLFTAQSAIPNVDWLMDIYDSQDAYIGTVGDTTTDGTFGFAWNLIGPGNVRHDDDFFYAVVTVTPTGQSGGGGSAATPVTVKNKDRWTNRGEWVVANQLAWSEDNGWVGGDNLDRMTDDFVNAAETFGMTVLPTHPYQEAARIHFSAPGDPQPTADWLAFRQALYHPNSRNVFYSGHGGTGGIGYNLSNTNVSIPVTEIANMLHTVPAGQTNRHNYRFVFLDGCETATSSKLAEAFGVVPRKNVPVEYYSASGERRSAFIGWNKSPAGGYANHLVNTDHWKFIQSFMFRLSTGEGVRSALNNAPGGPIPNGINPNHLTVYGYAELGYLQGNNN